tara:strand:+ start:1210 stop:1578 length:369 start_codon:yes stop_codon:yes gene_type:complete
MKIIRFFFLIFCLLQILYIFQYRSGFQYEVIKNPFSKDSGIYYAVSSEIIESREILEKTQLKNFNLSKKVKENTYLYQRIIEFNYPIRLLESSEYIFYLNDEIIPDYCEVLEIRESLKITKC